MRAAALPPGGEEVGIGASLFLIAAGAILAWAVNFDSSGIDLNTVGVILLVVGIIGLILSLLFWSRVSPFRRSRTVVEEDREVL
jgi:uncharacterized membrane protein YqjE